MHKITIPTGSPLLVQIENPNEPLEDVSFEIHHNTKEHPNEVVVVEITRTRNGKMLPSGFLQKRKLV